MRSLKFRAWDNEKREFLSDDYGPISVGDSKVVTDGDWQGVYYTDEYTIEQYTGLKDKNGKEIYEGDIVRWSFKVDRNSELTHTTDAVKWDSYDEEEWPYSTISGFTLPKSEDGYEVIGNIHEGEEEG